MQTYNLDGLFTLDLSITIDPAMQGSRAHGLAFNEEADIAAETQSQLFIGSCHAEIVAAVATDLLGADAPHDIFDRLHARGLVCHCD